MGQHQRPVKGLQEKVTCPSGPQPFPEPLWYLNWHHSPAGYVLLRVTTSSSHLTARHAVWSSHAKAGVFAFTGTVKDSTSLKRTRKQRAAAGLNLVVLAWFSSGPGSSNTADGQSVFFLSDHGSSGPWRATGLRFPIQFFFDEGYTSI